jgi:spore coat protein H
VTGLTHLSRDEVMKYSLFIHPGNIRELKSDMWCDDTVPAQLRVGRSRLGVQIAYRGSHIRKLRKKSYRLVFERPSTFHGAKEVHLNAEFSDPSLMRSYLSFGFFRELGVLVPNCNYCFIKINGLAEGIYLQLESVDEFFFQKRNLPCSSIYYAINDNANFSLISPIHEDVKKRLDAGYELKYGNDNETEQLCSFILQLNTESRANFGAYIQEKLNVENYLRWLAGVVCTQNFDAFIQNYTLYRNGQNGQFGIIPWDYDATWGRDIRGKFLAHDYVPIEGYNTLSARILDVSVFRDIYRNLMEETLETIYTPAHIEPQITSLHKLLRPYVLEDPYISSHLSQFDGEPDIILDFVKKRGIYLKDHLQELIG